MQGKSLIVSVLKIFPKSVLGDVVVVGWCFEPSHVLGEAVCFHSGIVLKVLFGREQERERERD